MRALTALLKREYLEHRGAFLYAPTVVLIIIAGAILFAALAGNADFSVLGGDVPVGIQLYRIGIGGAFFFWSGYLLIALFFYFADSFSADRRNNALLFWKSMPQSDLKILTSKALSALTIFLALILGFALLTAILAYPLLVIAASRHTFIVAPAPSEALADFVQMSVVGVVYLVLTLLWYAPALAWVAGLSTLFQRWSIPLAALIPGTVMLLEYMNSLRGPGIPRPIAGFLDWRFEGFPDEARAATLLLVDPDGGPFALVELMLSEIDWLHMALGLIFSAAIVYLASEYRRRRIEA